MGRAAEIWQEDVTEGEICVGVMWETGRSTLLRTAAVQSGRKKGRCPYVEVDANWSLSSQIVTTFGLRRKVENLEQIMQHGHTCTRTHTLVASKDKLVKKALDLLL